MLHAGFATSAALLLLSMQAAHAADAERGRAVAQQWCSVCHAETVAETTAVMEVSFEQLANRPENDAARLRAIMDEDHFPMTTFRLFDGEKDDVVAYLVSLREASRRP